MMGNEMYQRFGTGDVRALQEYILAKPILIDFFARNVGDFRRIHEVKEFVFNLPREIPSLRDGIISVRDRLENTRMDVGTLRREYEEAKERITQAMTNAQNALNGLSDGTLFPRIDGRIDRIFTKTDDSLRVTTRLGTFDIPTIAGLRLSVERAIADFRARVSNLANNARDYATCVSNRAIEKSRALGERTSSLFDSASAIAERTGDRLNAATAESWGQLRARLAAVTRTDLISGVRDKINGIPFAQATVRYDWTDRFGNAQFAVIVYSAGNGVHGALGGFTMAIGQTIRMGARLAYDIGPERTAQSNFMESAMNWARGHLEFRVKESIDQLITQAMAPFQDAFANMQDRIAVYEARILDLAKTLRGIFDSIQARRGDLANINFGLIAPCTFRALETPGTPVAAIGGTAPAPVPLGQVYSQEYRGQQYGEHPWRRQESEQPTVQKTRIGVGPGQPEQTPGPTEEIGEYPTLREEQYGNLPEDVKKILRGR
jgi:hypothetical protein